MRRQLRLLIPVSLFACLPLFLLSCGETSAPITSSVPAGKLETRPVGARGADVRTAGFRATIMNITVPNGGTTACLPVPWAVPGEGGAITTINVTTLPSHGTMNTLQLGGSAALNCEPGFMYTNDAADNSTTDTFTITANCISGPCEGPITFHVTITPPPAEEMIQNLKEEIENLPIHPGVKSALCAKLERAAAALDNGNIGAACRELGAFINCAQVHRGKKLTEAQADELIAAAQAIMDAIPCP